MNVDVFNDNYYLILDKTKAKIMKQVLLLVFFLTLFACKQEYKPENKIKEDVVFLSDDKLEGRQTGSEGEKAAADFISKRFKAIGLEPKGTNGYFQEFTFTPKKDPHSKAEFTNSSSDGTITGKNVLGYIDNNAKIGRAHV